ncbi:MAG: hypothetical protein JNM07_00965 [Phycisphaerae bacterium]|nr:hypothetical protein [Phycisphaerae bacterium]
MSVTAKLLRVFRVDQQLRGLQSRLQTSKRFLAAQSEQQQGLDAKRKALEGQVRQLRATLANEEGEVQRIEARSVVLREQMNNAKTNKEYSAFLAELNTLKNEKSKHETAALEHMSGVEALDRQVAEIVAQLDERSRMVAQADKDCKSKETEIRDRVDELKSQRDVLAKDVPAPALAALEALIVSRGDEAMCGVDVLDRRNHEYTCGGCMMAIPMERVNSLVRGNLTNCPSCQCILYTEEELIVSRKGTSKPAKSGAAADRV